MDKRTFEAFRKIVYDASGISLSDNKEALVSARVGKRLRALGMSDYKEYLDFLVGDKNGEEIVQFLDVISTNVTSFFRENAHFDVLTKLVQQWSAEGQRRFRFWSAACSTGEEPYSMAMTIQEALGKNTADVKILATDISTRVLDQCIAGRYDKQRVETVPAKLRPIYFEVERTNSALTTYVIKPALKRLIVFKRINLSTPPFPMQGPMDVIFCRNVMIYFDNIVRQRLVDEMTRLLKPGGYLMLGHSESLTGLESDLRVVSPTVYVKEP